MIKSNIIQWVNKRGGSIIKRQTIYTIMTAFVLLIGSGLIGRNSLWSYAPLDLLPEEDKKLVDISVDLIDKARNRIWQGESDNMSSLLGIARDSAIRIKNKAAGRYLQARIELNLGRIELLEKDKKKAIKHFDAAMELAQSSVDSMESSEGLRVLASSASMWMVNKGFFAIIATGAKVNKWSERATKLDPLNALASLVYIQALINAPRSFGGDPQRAEKLLLRLHSRDDLNDVERFWTRASLSDVYKKLKKKSEQERWCDSAAAIAPMNPLIEECR